MQPEVRWFDGQWLCWLVVVWLLYPLGNGSPLTRCSRGYEALAQCHSSYVSLEAGWGSMPLIAIHPVSLNGPIPSAPKASRAFKESTYVSSFITTGLRLSFDIWYECTGSMTYSFIPFHFHPEPLPSGIFSFQVRMYWCIGIHLHSSSLWCKNFFQLASAGAMINSSQMWQIVLIVI